MADCSPRRDETEQKLLSKLHVTRMRFDAGECDPEDYRIALRNFAAFVLDGVEPAKFPVRLESNHALRQVRSPHSAALPDR